MLKIRKYSPLVVAALLLAGCGTSGEAPVRVVPPAPEAKETLLQIVSTGDVKGVKKQLHQEIEGMREAKPEQTDKLLAEFQKLVDEKDPAQRKAIAQQMADTL